MLQALKGKAPHLYVERGLGPDQLRHKVREHYSRNKQQFFLLIGELSCSSTKFVGEIEEKLGIPGTSLRNHSNYVSEDIEQIVDLAINPDCQGVVAFGLTEDEHRELSDSLNAAGVGAIKDDPDGDSYAIFSNSKRIKPREAEMLLRKLIVLSFD